MPPREVDAPVLITGGAAHDETASLRLVVRSVIAAVLGEGKDHPDVEDCTHEALSRALEGRSRLREGEPLRPWVLGIARHVALDALRERRRARREQPSESAVEEASAQPTWLERLADPAPGPEERAASAERGRRLQAAMLTLSNEQRSALVMFHVDGLGYQEIARRLGVPLGTVATWISRGRRSIADALGE
jgi:RNA polymerase sigma-70 factor (ECF subfamily)